MKITGVELDFMTDDMLRLLLENNMRRGPSSSMGSRYVERGERKIVYEDMKILYCWVMSQKLPTGDFCESKVTKSSLEAILGIPDIDEHGFLIEYDLEYSHSTHSKTKNFPILSDKKTIKAEVFSPYVMKNKPENYKPTEKLIMDQTKKQRYFLYYRDLKFSEGHGTRIVKVPTVFNIKQSPRLAKFIENNTEQRSKAKTENENYFYKVMNNSFYAKMIANIKKRSNLDLIDKSDTHRILN